MRKYVCDYGVFDDTYCKDYDGACLRDEGYYKCTASRYVRADVAMRYAMIKERKGYILARSPNGLTPDYTTGYPVAQTLRYATYEEALRTTEQDGAK